MDPLNRPAFLCGPTRTAADPDDTGPIGAVPPDRLTVEDRHAVDTFAAFLSGSAYVCPSCMEQDDECGPDARCCPSCPGVHITGAPLGKIARRAQP
jgi:hypothetical protein